MRPQNVLMYVVVMTFLASACSHTQTLPLGTRYEMIGRTIITALPTAPFPHPARQNGHTWDGKHYPAGDHYTDSTVVIFVPDQFESDKPFDIIVHIHGWWNNVDSSFSHFELAAQVSRSARNVILVVPEGPKNAPDSFGGRLEETGVFAAFIGDVMSVLRDRSIVSKDAEPGIILSGHSGAYRMISFILARGGLTERIREVYLFDALYGQLEKYSYWLDHSRGRFVAIYTDGGGTKGTTESLMEDLNAWKIPYGMVEETALADSDLTTNRILFIHTDLEHNDVIAKRSQLEKYLRTGRISKFE